jgi:hypothetical protein
MSFSTTITWTTGQTVTAAQMNAQVSANMDVANLGHVTVGFVGSLTSGAKAGRWVAPYPVTVNNARGSVGTASTSGSVVFDVLKTPAAGSTAVTLFTSSSALPTVSSGTFDGPASVPSVTAFAAGDVMTFAVVDDGSAATADATVIISVSGA